VIEILLDEASLPDFACKGQAEHDRSIGFCRGTIDWSQEKGQCNDVDGSFERHECRFPKDTA
jgi:hypothetical protein